MDPPPYTRRGHMRLALAEADKAGSYGEVPVGAAVVEAATGVVVAEAGNRVEALNDPTAHAEILALRLAAARKGTPRLQDCDLYVTLEPCAMCAAAIAHARIRRLIFGAYDHKSGGVDHGARVFAHPTCHHRPEVIGGVRELEASALLKSFFQRRR